MNKIQKLIAALTLGLSCSVSPSFAQENTTVDTNAGAPQEQAAPGPTSNQQGPDAKAAKKEERKKKAQARRES